MSSAQVAVCGRKSENKVPDCPDAVNFLELAQTAASGFTKANFRSFVNERGSGFPFHFSSSGFGSNRSSWLGPPAMNRQMTFFAVALRGGCLGARGFGSFSAAIRFANAIDPNPKAHFSKNRLLL